MCQAREEPAKSGSMVAGLILEPPEEGAAATAQSSGGWSGRAGSAALCEASPLQQQRPLGPGVQDLGLMGGSESSGNMRADAGNKTQHAN